MRDGRRRAILWAGVCLPDAIAWFWTAVLASPVEVTAPLRSPLGVLPWCAAGALLFEPDWRGRAFVALLLGAWIRLALGGPIYWAFPFSMARLDWPVPAWVFPLIPLAEVVARRLNRTTGSSARGT